MRRQASIDASFTKFPSNEQVETSLDLQHDNSNGYSTGPKLKIKGEYHVVIEQELSLLCKSSIIISVSFAKKEK